MHVISKRKILMVIHGQGRGRSVPTGDVFLNRLVATGDPLFNDIRVHATCTGVPDLSDIGVVMFWLGDPLKQKYPTCYLDALAIANEAAGKGIRIINHPDALSNTSKSDQARIWLQNGIPCAQGQAAANTQELVSAIRSVGYPCIVRSDQEHAQRKIFTLKSDQDLRANYFRSANEAAVLKFHDIRQEFRDSGADWPSLYKRYHHKARAFVFGGRVMASHLFFSDEKIVGLSNCLFSREAGRYRTLARKLGYHRKLFADLIEADRQFFCGPIAGAADLVRAVQVLGLDFAAVDYSLRPDGSIIIWEANPYFWLPDGKASVLSGERDAVSRVNQSFDWMAERLKSYLPDRGNLTLVSDISA